MPSNPFARKRTPLDEARRRLDTARDDAADVARSVRDAADDVVKTLESSTASSRIPVIAGAAAATLGVGLYVAKRIRGPASRRRERPAAAERGDDEADRRRRLRAPRRRPPS